MGMAIPEPSGLAMGGLGAVGLLVYRGSAGVSVGL
jgi:hypothetical protein